MAIVTDRSLSFSLSYSADIVPSFFIHRKLTNNFTDLYILRQFDFRLQMAFEFQMKYFIFYCLFFLLFGRY